MSKMTHISKQLNIYFDKLEDWEIQKLIEACEQELEIRSQEIMSQQSGGTE